MNITDKKEFSFERLVVWQEAMELAQQVYSITKVFPKDELYGMTSQLRRAAISVPTNIAEGRGRFHKKEQIQFFCNSRGSLYEVASLLKLSSKFNYLEKSDSVTLENLCQKIAGQLNGLINSLKESSDSPVTNHPSPVTGQSSPVTRQSSPVTRQSSPVTGHRSPLS